MKAVFMGTPTLAVPFLSALHEAGHEISLVLTGPDKPVGRGGRVTPPPVKERAEALGLSLYQPEKLKDEEVFSRLENTGADLFVIVAYRILPARLIKIPRLGCLNVHASLLPKYRGAAPIAWAIIQGETRTGVTTMLIDEGVDTGAILLQEACPIEPEDDAPRLEDKLTRIGIRLMLQSVEGLLQGTLHPKPQDRENASRAPKLKKENGRIEWTRTAREIHNLRRGLCPWPGTFTYLRNRLLKIHDTRVAEHPSPKREVPPGQVVAGGKEGIRVACGGQTELLLLEVQPEGKKRMRAESLLMGRYLKVGDRFEVQQ